MIALISAPVPLSPLSSSRKVTRDRMHVTHRDGVLPPEQVLWLLSTVQHEEMRLPTAEELEQRRHQDFDEAHGVG